ncbi:MAG: chromosome segregation protein SMC [Thermodesulfovibrionia bacterium]|nr:MAG: chromosome segregation protein SMC [Thermodesulfovibrionia bacterium]
MRIEKIELTGFKSFSEKTVFNFHHGITAVVGPNGCGKSNIVDAFKWVLGEQSAKSLRGDRMEDVIFAGSASKKPRGMAEVTLFISGVNNGGSPGAGEISVTRRLYRSGESEYLMNKTPCRLKDIKNVFLDTGLELKAYSVLEQGKMDAILNSKPIERRFLIEEVAGVMKYNVRKAEAVQKLEASRSNLQRLQDIITEVKRQINSIDRHAKRAQKYKRLFEEIKNIEVKIAVRDVTALGRELTNFTDSESRLKSAETELSTNIHSSDALIEEKKLMCVEKEKALEGIQNKLNTAEKEFIEEEGRISLLKSDCENLKSRLQRLQFRDSELTGEKEDISSQIKEIKNKSDGMSLGLSDIEKILESRNASFSTLEKEITDLEQNLEVRRRDIFNKAEEVSSLKNEVSNLSLFIESIDKKESRNLEDINSVKDGISSLASSIKETEDKHHALDAELKDRNNAKEGLLNSISRAKKELTAKEEGLYRDREALAAMSSRAESLMELDTGGKSAVKENVKILCHVADIFEALPEHETAIEAALGEKLKAAVVDDHNEIKKALRFIKQEKINRSGFICANISPASHSQSAVSFPPDSVIGKAIDFVKVKEGFDRIAVLLLGDVIIVKNLDTAFDVWHASLSASSVNPGYFVTLDGEVLEPLGMVFGGIERGVLKIKREIRELEKNIMTGKADIALVEKGVSSLKNDITSDENNLASLDSEVSQMEKIFHELQMKMANMQGEEVELQRKLEFLLTGLEGEKKEKDSTQQILNEKNKVCIALEDERLFIEKDMREVQAKIADKKTLLEKMRSELTETMLSRTAIKEKMDSLLREGERLNSELSGIEKKREEMSKEHLEIESDIKDKEDEIQKKESALRSSVVIVNELKGQSSELKEMLEAKTADLNLMEKQQKAFMDELASVRKELSHVEVKKTELSLTLEHIRGDIKKTYSVDIDSITEDQGEYGCLLPEEEERLPGLREKLQEIGPVNLGTLEELEELKERYDFLKKQQEDLLQAIESLQDTISRINMTTRKRLTDAFDALNEKFKEVFTLLFGKGRAELILTEGSILEAGIDVVAQPPGKKLQNLMLLSGGETALTALSLLFAGFMIKPTPLCLLDEVDAPLDESNTDRFTSLLSELAKNIQFIIITHNRRTMEAADYLYGITMEEPGISKVVSMHLAEAV